MISQVRKFIKHTPQALHVSLKWYEVNTILGMFMSQMNAMSPSDRRQFVLF